MSIYTKFGDKGKTSLYAGKTVSKGSLRVNAYGTVDELNSFLGIVLTLVKDKKLKDKLINIQKDLFEVGACLANPTGNKDRLLSKYLTHRVLEFEAEIDSLTKKLPKLEHFILPGGGKPGSSLHFARTLVRRAERRVVELSEKEKINTDIIIFLNRLSDLLFMYARDINYKEKQKELLWKSR
ncbi:MAG: cob(I)yrinic acid a,c-diamide adenosyltransferase [Candidatus Levybacteria bacterium]|nr:cob(I)yrinic acid a,c-diamide adenosyltransferase [Candidatus Levybacteria bacterium]